MRLPRFSKPIRSCYCAIGCFLLLFLACAILDIPRVFFSAMVASRTRTCSSNLRRLATALLMYSQDWDETLPPAGHWADSASLLLHPADIPQVFHCPGAPS